MKPKQITRLGAISMGEIEATKAEREREQIKNAERKGMSYILQKIDELLGYASPAPKSEIDGDIFWEGYTKIKQDVEKG